MLRNITIVDGDGEVYPARNLLIIDDVIAEVTEKEVSSQPDWEVLNGRDLVVSPGLVNGHCHSPMTLMRGLGEDLVIENWFNDFIWRYESRLEPSDVLIGAKLGISEMLKNGVTAFADHYFFADSIAQAALDLGIRADIAPTIFGLSDEVDQQFEQAIQLIQDWHNKEERIHFRMGPHAPYTCPPKVLARSVKEANKLGVGLHIHISETVEQVAEAKRNYHQTPFELVAKAGGFEIPIIVGHGLWIEREDLAYLGKDTFIAACPKTYLKLSMGLGRIWEYSSQLNLIIGTDGAASSNTLNPLEQARLFALLGKAQQGANYFTLKQAWKALMQGHQALGWNTGWVRKGYLADLVIWDFREISTYPWHNPLALLLYSADTRHINHVMVGGEYVVRSGKLTAQDEAKLLAEADRVVNSLAQKTEGQPMAEY